MIARDKRSSISFAPSTRRWRRPTSRASGSRLKTRFARSRRRPRKPIPKRCVPRALLPLLSLRVRPYRRPPLQWRRERRYRPRRNRVRPYPSVRRSWGRQSHAWLRRPPRAEERRSAGDFNRPISRGPQTRPMRRANSMRKGRMVAAATRSPCESAAVRGGGTRVSREDVDFPLEEEVEPRGDGPRVAPDREDYPHMSPGDFAAGSRTRRLQPGAEPRSVRKHRADCARSFSSAGS